MVALEANYDLHMLMHGPYPYYLKTRIASEKGPFVQRRMRGHAGKKLMAAGCTRFSLCHISQENNARPLPLQSVQAALAKRHGGPHRTPWCRRRAGTRYRPCLNSDGKRGCAA